MLQRIRKACAQGIFKLYKMVEVDETYIGSKEANKHAHKRLEGSQGGANKSIVFSMRQRQGRVKAQVIRDTKSKTLQGVLSNNIAPDTLLCIDELRGNKGVNYDRLKVNHSTKGYVNGMAHTNGIESVWAVLKRGYNGSVSYNLLT